MAQDVQCGTFRVAEIQAAAVENDANDVGIVDPQRKCHHIVDADSMIVFGKDGRLAKGLVADAIGNPLRGAAGMCTVVAHERMLAKVAIERRAVLLRDRLARPPHDGTCSELEITEAEGC